MIDSYVFGAQSGNVSEGRKTDGGATWTFFDHADPGRQQRRRFRCSRRWTRRSLRLLPNYPEPLQPADEPSLRDPRHDGHVRLEIYDVTGRLVSRLVDEAMPAGRHDVAWDGRDEKGSAVASGVYFSRLSFGGESLTGRLTLLR